MDQPTTPPTEQKCGSCERPTDARELCDHRGVCRFCHRSFVVAHRANHLTEPDGHRHDPHENEPHVEYDPYQLADELDRVESTPSSQAMAGDALRVLLDWIWSDRRLERGFDSAWRKFVSVSATIRPELVGDLSFQKIGEKLGCTRASISKHSREIQKTLHVHFRRGKREAAISKMRLSARGNHNRHNSFLKGT